MGRGDFVAPFSLAVDGAMRAAARRIRSTARAIWFGASGSSTVTSVYVVVLSPCSAMQPDSRRVVWSGGLREVRRQALEPAQDKVRSPRSSAVRCDV